MNLMPCRISTGLHRVIDLCALAWEVVNGKRDGTRSIRRTQHLFRYSGLHPALDITPVLQSTMTDPFSPEIDVLLSML
jgi:hypothetical protein